MHAKERRTHLTPNEYLPSTEQPRSARAASASWPRSWEQVPLAVAPNFSLQVQFASVATDDQGSWHILALALDGKGGNNLWYTTRDPDGSWQNSPVERSIGSSRLVSGAARNALKILDLMDWGTLWYTTRGSGGDWDGDWQNVPDATIKPISFVSCALDGGNYLHVLALDASNTLWWTLRDRDGGWPNPWSKVQDLMGGATIGPITMVSGSVDPNDFLHVFALDASNMLWYTIRRPNWSWQESWINVQETMDRNGLPAIGPTPWVCSAADPSRSGYVHLLAVSDGFGLWHTARDVTGAWTMAWENVSALVEPAIGPVCMASASVSGDGSLEIAAVDAGGKLQRTIRAPGER